MSIDWRLGPGFGQPIYLAWWIDRVEIGPGLPPAWVVCRLTQAERVGPDRRWGEETHELRVQDA